MMAQEAKARERLVTVCSACLRASCWQGQFMCDAAQGAGTVERTVSDLRQMAREHPTWWDDEAVA